MQCYTELTAPTAVSHSVSLSFLSTKSTNLVVAKTSLLQIFDFKSVVTEADANASEDVETLPQDIAADTLDRTFFTSDIALQKLETTSKLVLIAEFPLAGTISALGRVKKSQYAKTPADVLVVAFREAKMSLVGWDPERSCITTLSIHYYENSLPPAPWSPDLSYCPNYLAIDPSDRCALLRFGPRHVAIVPFRQDLDELGGDDFDSDLDDPKDRPQLDRKMTNGEGETAGLTPYSSSFVLSLTAVDPSLIFPTHLAFLYEYREPTFGILSSIRAPSNSMARERRDILTYKVFTLDLEGKESTNVLSVPNLPSDLTRVIALPLPVGGALLVGPNQLVHVDQSGKTTAVAVNELAKQLSSFGMVDQSHLKLRLENCSIEQLGESGDMMIVTTAGQLVVLSFQLDGRSVAGLSLHMVTADQGCSLVPKGVSSCTTIGRGRIFLGSEDNDSVLLGWSRKTTQLSRKRSLADMLGEEAELSDDDLDGLEDDDDDIYGEEPNLSKSQSRASVSDPIGPADLVFRIHDRLPNFAPAGDMTLGKVSDAGGKLVMDSNGLDAVEMIYPSGRGRDGGLVICRRDVNPVVSREMELPNIKSLWAFHLNSSLTKGLMPKGKQDSEALLSADAAFDQYILVSEAMIEGEDESFLYAVKPKGDLKKVEDSSFDNEGATVDIGIMSNGTRLVQVKVGEVRVYNSDFELEQILPIADDSVVADLTVLSASFAGPYLLILRSDSSIMIFDESSGELEELDTGKSFSKANWLSACLYKPVGDADAESNQILAFCLTSEGGLRIYELPSLGDPVYKTDGLPFLPAFISDGFAPRRYAARETLTELLVADVGDSTAKTPYLILRTSLDDIVLYQPFYYPSQSQSKRFTHNLRWLKVSQPRLATKADLYSEENRVTATRPALRRFSNIGGYSTVIHVGTSTSFILKEASSSPKVVRLTGAQIGGITEFHSEHCDNGFITVDVTGAIRLCQLPPQTRFGDSGWPMKKLRMGEEVSQVCYFEPKGLYAIATTKKTDFKLPEDDHHKEWANEDTTFLPQTNQGVLKLLHPKSWTTVDTLELDPDEICLSITTANLSTSENTTSRKPFLCVGTVGILGEEQAARGKIFVLDVINVVPEPGKPETGHKLKIHAKEDVKGAVTALSEIGSQGFLLVAQGQRVMVRGLIEADKLVPVAFQDIQCFVTSAKVLKGTGMILLGDVAKGVWFTGYTEEPYKITLFGRTGNMEVTAAEFLPHEKSLYIIVADADKNVHIMQYDPENVRSQSGRRLIHKSTFHSGHFAVGMHLLPSTLPQPNEIADSPSEHAEDMMDEDSPPVQVQQHILVLNQTGVFALISPVDELLYLRLIALQTYLTAQLDHACGLNPRGYRTVESGSDIIGGGSGAAAGGLRGGGAGGIKGVVDGTLLRRWAELPKQRQVEASARVGVDEEDLRGDLDIVGGEGLGYL